MIITSKKKTLVPLLFVHIPKTAGGSVKDYFNYEDKFKTGHKNINQIKKLISSNNLKFRDYFKFVIFRNPWDRMLSNFNYRISHSKDTYWKNIKKKNFSFNDWLKKLTDEVGINNLKKNNSYFSYINIKNKIAVDYIINFHNLNEDFNLIKKISNIKIKRNLKSNGKSAHKASHKIFKHYYNSKSINIVEKIHEKDIELFNFSFDDYKSASIKKYFKLSKVKNIL
jgi:hypothetical protein